MAVQYKDENQVIEDLTALVNSLRKIDSALKVILEFKITLNNLTYRHTDKMSFYYQQIAKELDTWGYHSVIDMCIGESHYLSQNKCLQYGYKNLDKIDSIQEVMRILINSILSKF